MEIFVTPIDDVYSVT